jgi:D-alanyl-lipoteichoic acid acyltransferase DltB (MBOAT superfamily)
MTNFNIPYISASFKEFWARWHISLSTWFRDYLYIPLGGNRVKTSRNLINIFVVFLISGLWHGANWTFVVWGCIHGLLLVLEHGINLKLNRKLPKLFKQVFVFSMVLISWIYFRANNITQANHIIIEMIKVPELISSYLSGQSIFKGFGDISIPNILGYLVLLSIFFSFDIIQQKLWFKKVFLCNSKVRMGIYFILLYCIIFLGYFGETTFIYFQF